MAIPRRLADGDATDNNVGPLDAAYIWLRDNIVRNLPLEQQERGRRFFGTWRDAYNPGVINAIHRNDARDPFQLLKLHSAKIDDAYSIA